VVLVDVEGGEEVVVVVGVVEVEVRWRWIVEVGAEVESRRKV